MAFELIAKRYLKPMSPIRTGMAEKGTLHKPVRCLLCDLYGTLVISGSGDIGTLDREVHRMSAVKRLLSSYGLPASAERTLDNLQNTIARLHSNKRASGIEHPEIRIEEAWQQTLPELHGARLKPFVVEMELILNPVWSMPHARQLLSVCRSRGILLGIISNAQFYTNPFFKELFGADWSDLGFDPSLVVLSYQYGRAKPDPYLFETARKKLDEYGITDRQTAFIGNDLQKDIVPASRVGFQTILFAGDQRSLRLHENEPSLDRAVVPDLVVTDLLQLIQYL